MQGGELLLLADKRMMVHLIPDARAASLRSSAGPAVLAHH